jgi:hypothetical protein
MPGHVDVGLKVSVILIVFYILYAGQAIEYHFLIISLLLLLLSLLLYFYSYYYYKSA